MSLEDQAHSPRLEAETAAIPAASHPPEPSETLFLKWMIFGSSGVRVGWRAALFIVLTLLCMQLGGVLADLVFQNLLHRRLEQTSPILAIVSEAICCIAILAAGAVCAFIEHRHLQDYYFSGSGRLRRFAAGSLAGVVALTALVGVLFEARWLRFDAVALSGVRIVEFAALWAVAFLLTALFEEGSARCYLLFTLARGINFWWAFGSVAALSFLAAINPGGNGNVGVYAAAAAGLLPCLLLHLRKDMSAGFWQAAWLTSTFFGYVHTFNDGETWIGIFSAALIGFVFCASVRLTGSIWWALGFHASWDWAQTFFYGTPDSGMTAHGHYLSTHPAGPSLWSGGSDGPEGSLLVIPVVLMVLLGLTLVYGRQKPAQEPLPAGPEVTA